MMCSLTGFIIINPDHPPSWLDPRLTMLENNMATAIAGILILVADVFLPVFNSMVMAINGKIFGLWGGATLSVIGSLGAVILGYLLGVGGKNWEHKLLNPKELEQANHLITKYGALALIVSRPIPMLAEALTIVAGLNGFGLKRSLFYSMIGILPVSLAFAMMGDTTEAGVKGFVAVIVTSTLFWLIGQRLVDKG